MTDEDIATRILVRFTLSILDECQGPRELANVMHAAIAGLASTDEINRKLGAFASGLASIEGSPLPVTCSLVWGSA